MTESSLPPDDAATLSALPHLATVDLLIPDSNGLLRGKRINASALEKVYTQGICLPTSLFGADITGDTTEATGLGFDIGDRDAICMPIAGSLKPIPWQEPQGAQLLLTMLRDDGKPFDVNPREILQRQLSLLHAQGWYPVVAVELEFYLLDNNVLDQNSRHHDPQPPLNPITGQRDQTTQVYYMDDLDAYQSFISDVREATQAQGIPADAAVAEYAPGQFEINLTHSADVLAACDHAVYLKRAIKAIADKHGHQATFMAKPYVERAGSGAHIHVSLLDRKDANLFACPEDQPNDFLRHAIGGLQATMAEAMLIFAPHANSYRRFQEDSFVPMNTSWGFNNRTVALRIPAGQREDRRIEHRVAGADTNPYLATAAVLAGIHWGLTQTLECNDPVTGNAYVQTPPTNPRFWQDTIRLFQYSDWAARYFGTNFRHVYTELKKAELNEFQRYITPLEYEWYLRSV